MMRLSRSYRTALWVAAALLLSGGLVTSAIPSRAADAGIELAQLPKDFDDYTPPAKSEELPPEGGSTGGGTTGGGTTGGGGAKLTYRHILGKWCSASSNYIIARTQLTVILTSGGTPSSYRVVGFDFTSTTAIVHWITADNRRVNTTFGRFSADGKQMVQIAVNRTYRRCDTPATASLSYGDILGSWCDVDSKYVITRNQLTVVFSGGRSVNYKITGFRFEKEVIEMYWLNNAGKPSRTRFGRYTSDRRTMTQLGPNRIYRRC